MISTIQPITGNNHSNCHQPLREVSCSRRVPTASEGSSTSSEYSDPRCWCTSDRTKLATKLNSANHQYSERDARPAKSAYREKHCFTDS